MQLLQFPILTGPHKGGFIRMTKYEKTDAGVAITITHNVHTSPGKQLQWIQSVSSNGGNSTACNMKTRIDPFGLGGAVNTVSLPSMPGSICKADDLLPFYYTHQELDAGYGHDLIDGPQVPTPPSGRVWTAFVTALTEVSGKDVHNLVAVRWGYEHAADNTVRLYPPRTPNAAELADYFRTLRRMYPDYRYS